MKTGAKWHMGSMAFFLILFLVCLPGASAQQTSPVLNKGKKWRIAYLEGGAYINYQGSFKSTIQNLMAMGWIEKADIPEARDIEETRSLWNWLSGHARSQYLEFPENAYWTCEWNNEKRTQNKAEIRERMKQAKDIDLFIAMGTWAGQDLVSILDTTPVIVMSCSDPVRAGIVTSTEDSGKNNVLAWCDPTRVKRRMRLFHDIFGFKKLGFIYENNKDGKIYSNFSDIQAVAGERNFKLVECHAAESNRSLEETQQEITGCIDQMAAHIDAFVVTNHRGFHLKYFPEMLEPLFQKGVPAFSMVLGPAVVHRGALMGIAREDFQPLGHFYADAMVRIFNGCRPCDLEQVYQEPIRLSINLEAAKLLGFEIPPNLRKVADIVDEHIDRTPLD